MRRVLFAISGHGLGHLGQMSAIMRELRARRPDLAIVVRSSIERARIEERLGFAVEHAPARDDFGVELRDGFAVDLPATARAYDRLYDRWTDVLRRARAGIGALRPDLVVANVGFVPLAAGAGLGIPSVGLSSLDWYTVLDGYWGGERARVLRLIDDAYASAQGLLALAPATAEAGWRRRVALGPTADLGRRRGRALRDRLGLPAAARIVLCAFGNSAPPPPRTDLLACPGTIFLVPRRWHGGPATVAIDDLLAARDWPFVDLLASCDACLTKLGYGIAAEAVRNDVGLLYHRRPGWKEDVNLAAWLGVHGRAVQVDLAALDAAALSGAIAAVSALPPRPAIDFVDPETAISHLLGFAG